MRGFSFALVRTMESIILSFVLSLYAILSKSQALCRKFTSLTSVARPVFVQPLSLTPFDSSPSRGASGGTVHFAGTAKASPTRRGGIASAMTERLYEGEPDLFHAKKDRCISAAAFSLRIRRGDDSRIS